MKIRSAVLSLVASLSFNAYGAAPIISQVADQSASQNNTYTFKPTLSAGGIVNWSKTYGPDEVKVHPGTGTVTWTIPQSMASESFHIGVQATNGDGVDEEVWIVHVGVDQVISVGAGGNHSTVKAALAALNGGGTLVLKNGVYTGLDNTIAGDSRLYSGQNAPSGSANAYTTIIAEDPGQAIFDGQHTIGMPIRLGGNYYGPLNTGTTSLSPSEYIALKGMEIHNALQTGFDITRAQYIKVYNVGLNDSGVGNAGNGTENVPNGSISKSNFIIVEGLYSWGYSRYRLNFYLTTNVAARRNVGRVDGYQGTDPVGGFQNYCSQNISHQNSIVLDSNQDEFWTRHTYYASSFAVSATNCHDVPRGISFDRTVSVNNTLSVADTAARESNDPTIWRDVIGWDIDLPRYSAGTGSTRPLLNSWGPTIVEYSTFGHVDANPGFRATDGGTFFFNYYKPAQIRNNIIYNFGWDGSQLNERGRLFNGSTDGLTATHNAISNFSDSLSSGKVTITNSHDINPINNGLKYLPRLEASSPLHTAASGDRIGANAMTFKGTSGSYWGTVESEQETNIPMWPFPNERLIRDRMKNYSYTGMTRSGSTKTLTGDRGFAVDGETLTNYIWGYLGNIVPPFNVHSYPSDSGKVTVLWDPAAPNTLAAIDGYRVYNVGSGAMVAEVTNKNIMHADISGLKNGQEYTFKVVAYSGGTESSHSYTTSATPVERPKPSAPPGGSGEQIE